MAIILLRYLEKNYVSEELIKEIYNRVLFRASREPISFVMIVSSECIEAHLTYNNGVGHFIFMRKENGEFEIGYENESVGEFALLDSNIVAPNSNENKPAASESIKNDFTDKKPRWDLLPIDELGGVVDVYTAGAKKYGENRWQTLPNGVNRYMGAFFRHLTAHKRGEHFDPEDGCLHLDKCIWNMIAVRHCFLADQGINPNTSDYSALRQENGKD